MIELWICEWQRCGFSLWIEVKSGRLLLRDPQVCSPAAEPGLSSAVWVVAKLVKVLFIDILRSLPNGAKIPLSCLPLGKFLFLLSFFFFKLLFSADISADSQQVHQGWRPPPPWLAVGTVGSNAHQSCWCLNTRFSEMDDVKTAFPFLFLGACQETTIWPCLWGLNPH